MLFFPFFLQENILRLISLIYSVYSGLRFQQCFVCFWICPASRPFPSRDFEKHLSLFFWNFRILILPSPASLIPQHSATTENFAMLFKSLLLGLLNWPCVRNNSPNPSSHEDLGPQASFISLSLSFQPYETAKICSDFPPQVIFCSDRVHISGIC